MPMSCGPASSCLGSRVSSKLRRRLVRLVEAAFAFRLLLFTDDDNAEFCGRLREVIDQTFQAM